MRKFFLAFAIVAAFFALSAQDNSNDLYQQYLNQYTNNQPAQAEPAKPAEPAPAQPAAEPEKKEEPAPAAAPAEEKKEEAAQPEEKKEEAAPAEENKEEAAPAEEKKEEAAPAEEGDDKIAPFETKPFFSADAFMALSNSIYTFGGDVMPHSSYRFSIDNAVVDLKGGNRMFNARILFDLAKGLKTTKEVEFNYDHDSTLPTDGTNPLEFVETSDSPNALDVLKDVSVNMVHPSYRNAAGSFGLNVELQAGLFGMPFGIESGYDHEITYAHSAIKNDFLGGAFRDVGVSLGFDFLIGSKMDLDLTLYVFNGKNETMLDGEDRFKDPAFGMDLRYKYNSRFYATAAFSLVVGSAYMGYDEETEGGIFQTTNGTYLDEKNKIDENLILKDDTGRNDYAVNKKNIIFAVGADLGYQINDDVNVGFMGEFAYSNRSIFNPYANIYIGGDYYENARFIRDGNDGMIWGKSSYNPWGFFAMPYAHVYWFDMMARFSYFKQPYLYTFIQDSENTNMGVDFTLIYNFCDYAGVEFDYNFIRETRHLYDEAYSKDQYYTNTYNTHVFTIALTGWFDFLWEGKEEAAADGE
ncbi:hypothetical protein IJG44_02725 [bacterium]|nr:hypothetical protein [bacterium]